MAAGLAGRSLGRFRIEREAGERSIYVRVEPVDEDWSEDVSRLIDMLADCGAFIPDDLLQRHDLQLSFNWALMKMPPWKQDGIPTWRP